MKTHVFPLVSGIECEVSPLLGEHQRILTEGGASRIAENVNKVLVSCIVRLGSKKPVIEADVEALLAADRKKILVEVRQFSLDFNPDFRFLYQWKEDDYGPAGEVEHVCALDADSFTVKPYRRTDENGKPGEPFPPIAELSEIAAMREHRVKLPLSGKLISFLVMTGKEETVFAKMTGKRSTHTPILARMPAEVVDGERSFALTAHNLDRMPLRDIETLRGAILAAEGDVDTTLEIHHPDNPDRTARIDVVANPSFFFPRIATT